MFYNDVKVIYKFLLRLPKEMDKGKKCKCKHFTVYGVDTEI